MQTIHDISSMQELDQILGAAVNTHGGLDTVIHAGHYALVQRGGHVTDCLNEARFPEAGMGFSGFAKETWQSACRVAADPRNLGHVQLMVLVNDWQYVASGGTTRRQAEREVAQGREEYYRLVNRLPDFHLAAMAKYGLEESIVLRDNGHHWLWSESALRYELTTLVKEILADPVQTRESGIQKYFNAAGEPIVEICDDETGKIRLLYCGNTNCAGEVLSLLRRLYLHGVRNFINVFPAQCKRPVAIGTRMAYKLFVMDNMHITNVAVQDFVRDESTSRFHVEHFGARYALGD